MEQSELRILVFSKTVGFRHTSIESGLRALDQLATEQGFRIDATEESSVFNPQNLAMYGAVVFLSTTGDVLDDEQQRAFTQFIQAGGGFVGIHSASDTEYEWPWYGQLVGAYFESHPSNPNVREGTLLVVERNHPATANLPDPWVRADEWYEFRDFQDDVTVLLDIDEQSYKQADENPAPAPRPIAWFQVFDGGRAFYTALGHTSESYRDTQFLDHVWGGLRWVLEMEGPRLSRQAARQGSAVLSGVLTP
jgi:type 1 glutamine amidotransferase